MKKATKIGLKSFGLATGVGAIVIVGYLTYNVVYENVNYTIANKNARDTYSERTVKFDGVSLDKDLSKYVFNKTGVNVGKDSYFEEVNQKINENLSLEELEEIATSYIRGYFEHNNSMLDDENIGLLVGGEKGSITYNGREIGLDPDAEAVFGDLIKTIGDIKFGTSDLEEEELKEKLVKQILASELYEVVTINEKQLTLRPAKCPNDDFTF